MATKSTRRSSQDAVLTEESAAIDEITIQSALRGVGMTNVAEDTLPIKGTRNGLLLTLEPGEKFSDIIEGLTQRLEQAPAFFKGASLAIDMSKRALKAHELDQIKQLLTQYNVIMRPPEVSISKPPKLEPVKTAEAKVPAGTGPYVVDEGWQAAIDASLLRETTDAILVRRTIRSGQIVQHPGSVIILGDVNSGGEVFAGGDIIVWGAIRGVVHAGYPDSNAAVVCGLLMAPLQLRIGSVLTRAPEDNQPLKPSPETASVKSGQLVVEAWTPGRVSKKI